MKVLGCFSTLRCSHVRPTETKGPTQRNPSFQETPHVLGDSWRVSFGLRISGLEFRGERGVVRIFGGLPH